MKRKMITWCVYLCLLALLASSVSYIECGKKKKKGEDSLEIGPIKIKGKIRT